MDEFHQKEKPLSLQYVKPCEITGHQKETMVLFAGIPSTTTIPVLM